MAIIQAWKCLKTGKLFESEKDYKKHRNQLAAQARNSLMITRSRRHYAHDLAEFVAVERSLPEFMDALIAEQKKFWPRARQLHDWTYGKTSITDWPELIAVSLHSVNYRDRVSNSHRCPVGGVTNWGSNDAKPKGYPGWTGRIEFKFRWIKKAAGYYPGSALFSAVNVHTGTGGGGGHRDDPDNEGYIIQSYGYGVEIFAHDHPGLWRHHARQCEQRRRAKAWQLLGATQSFALPEIEDDWEPPALPALKDYLANPTLVTNYDYA